MPASHRKSLVKANADLSIRQQCRLLNLPSSTFYRKPTQRCERDSRIMRTMDALHLEDPTRGTRRLAGELTKVGLGVSRDKVRTLMRIMRLKTIYRVPRTTVCDPGAYKYPYLLRGRTISRVNEVWQVDITYVPMERGFMYLFVILDVASRCVLGWDLSNTMSSDWVKRVLKATIARCGKPEIINSDQGSQFTSQDWVGYIKSLKTVKISMDGKGRALDNVYIERFFRTIKHEKLYIQHLATPKDLRRACKEFIAYYNHRRDHSSIGNRPPARVYYQAA